LKRIGSSKTAIRAGETRTDRDLVMIALGVLLCLLLALSGYLSLRDTSSGSARQIRGPVKDPKSYGLSPESSLPQKNPSDGLTGLSMPFTEGVSRAKSVYYSSLPAGVQPGC